ncbi:LPS O-antigen chain length determinant protein WzzB [Vibrio crassostreae]|uniref:LPS O-antigen chain length determinant protein WzzB n=1 Tax=Vibrio crassostreae TaxID=246167 RepID=UPI001B315851
MKQQSQPQTYSPPTSSIYTSNDEIDIKEVCRTLWEGKLIILLVTALFSVSSVGFALLAQEWWSSQAKVARAQPYDMAEYQRQIKQFQPVFDIYQEDGTVLVSQELEHLTDPDILFQRFLDAYSSMNNKREFLTNSLEIKQLSKNADVELSKDDLLKAHSQWFDKITMTVVDKKAKYSPYYLRFQSRTKESSFSLLNSYIDNISLKTHRDALNNLQALIEGKRNELIQQKKILESQAENKLLVETERAKYSMGIAKAAGVEKPVPTGSHSDIFDIYLGAKALKAKVVALESVNNLSVIEPRLQQINAKLDMLKNLEIDRTVEFQTFRYLESVEQPISRDKPKRALIVVLGTLLGGMLGVAIVLIRFAFRKED